MKRLLSTTIILLGLSPAAIAQVENPPPGSPNANPAMNAPDNLLPAPCGTNSSVADLDEPDHQGPLQPVATAKSDNRRADMECANKDDSARSKTPTQPKLPAK